MLLPIPSTGASRLLMLLRVGVLAKRERTLEAFDTRREYFDLDSRRRKSVRNALLPSDWYMGSETVAVTLEKSGDVGSGSSLPRRRPKQQSAMTASITPATRPGKKPTKTALVGNSF